MICFLVCRARAKSGLRILGAEASTDQWNVSVDMNPKHTVATVTALRRPALDAPHAARTADHDQDEDDDDEAGDEPQSRNKRTLPG